MFMNILINITVCLSEAMAELSRKQAEMAAVVEPEPTSDNKQSTPGEQQADVTNDHVQMPAVPRGPVPHPPHMMPGQCSCKLYFIIIVTVYYKLS